MPVHSCQFPGHSFDYLHEEINTFSTQGFQRVWQEDSIKLFSFFPFLNWKNNFCWDKNEIIQRRTKKNCHKKNFLYRNSSYAKKNNRIVTKGLQNWNPQRNVKANKRQTTLGSLTTPLKILPYNCFRALVWVTTT